MMYSIPYSHDFHTNWIGIGLTSKTDVSNDFDKMYYGNGPKFDRKDFYYDVNPIEFEGKDFTVRATCGTTHRPTIRVSK